jgi:ribosome-associated toxin RatA of RatAB toxin-antitoxin module
MALAEFHEVVNVDKDKLFAVITRYEDYPSFVSGCSSVKVERKGAGQARVKYQVNMMRELHYTLDHKEDAVAGKVSWTMVESDLLKKNTGGWELKSVGPGKTDVKYQIDIEFNISVPGFILKKLISGSLPSMVKSFVQKAGG